MFGSNPWNTICGDCGRKFYDPAYYLEFCEDCDPEGWQEMLNDEASKEISSRVDPSDIIYCQQKDK